MQKYFPHVLRIEPASNCNLGCSHCPTGTVDIPRGLMSDETFALILKNVEENKDYIKVIVLYHGGEPLLNKNFFQYVEHLRAINSNFYIKTVSNGMALTKTTVNRLLNSNIDLIEFSLDGISDKESEYIRRGSKTKKIINNIQLLINERKTNGLSRLKISITTTQFHRSKKAPPNQPPEIPLWLRKIFEDNVQYSANYAIKWPHMDHSRDFDLLHTVGPHLNRCDHLESTITIRSDGTVVPCCYNLTTQLPMGNIHSSSLQNIWIGDAYKNLRQLLTLVIRLPYALVVRQLPRQYIWYLNGQLN